MYKQKEIVLVPFPYSDLSSIKKRPVLIISNNDYNMKFNDVIVTVITSKVATMDAYSTPLTDRHLEYGFLPEESVIKVHKIFTIDKSRIIKKFSRIKNEKFSEVQNILKLLIKSEGRL